MTPGCHVIVKLLLVDTRVDDDRGAFTFNRQADDWNKVSGLLSLTVTRWFLHRSSLLMTQSMGYPACFGTGHANVVASATAIPRETSVKRWTATFQGGRPWPINSTTVRVIAANRYALPSRSAAPKIPQAKSPRP
jgi:hypothetical protein